MALTHSVLSVVKSATCRGDNKKQTKSSGVFTQSLTEWPDNIQIINDSLLMMRLVGNKQFISELSNTDIKSTAHDYSITASKTSGGDNIVQFSEYKNSEGQESGVTD
ncbi:MAG: hypothetical protein ACI9N9_001080 [Enterobacterales bacterium]|jgi:hypothetical protein